MTRQSDREYYAGRASAERELSQTAIDPVVAEIHARLADGYERLTAIRSGSRPVLHLVTG